MATRPKPLRSKPRAARLEPRVDPTATALAFLPSLWALDHGLRSLSKQMERRLGITGPQRLVLRLVGRSPKLTPSQLADALHLDRGTLSGVLERLVARQLLAREPHPSDGRSICLRLTARGRRFERDAPGTVEHCVQAALDRLKPAEVAAARAVLDAIVCELEAGVAPRARARR